MKRWTVRFSVVFAFLIGCSSLYGEVFQIKDDRFPPPGEETVSKAYTEYRQGHYDVFLDDLDRAYRGAGKAGVLRPLFAQARKAIQRGNGGGQGSKHGDKVDPSALMSMIEAQKGALQELNKERNTRLLDAIAKDPEIPTESGSEASENPPEGFSDMKKEKLSTEKTGSNRTEQYGIFQKVDSVAFSKPSVEYDLTLAELDVLQYTLPTSSKGTIENRISALATEYYIKSLLLELGAHCRNGHAKELDSELAKKKMILEFDKLNKMQRVAQEMRDGKWLEKIYFAKRVYQMNRAFRIDFQVLKDLAEGKIPVKNSVEKKVKEVMIDYLILRRKALAKLSNS